MIYAWCFFCYTKGTIFNHNLSHVCLTSTLFSTHLQTLNLSCKCTSSGSRRTTHNHSLLNLFPNMTSQAVKCLHSLYYLSPYFSFLGCPSLSPVSPRCVQYLYGVLVTVGLLVCVCVCVCVPVCFLSGVLTVHVLCIQMGSYKVWHSICGSYQWVCRKKCSVLTLSLTCAVIATGASSVVSVCGARPVLHVLTALDCQGNKSISP